MPGAVQLREAVQSVQGPVQAASLHGCVVCHMDDEVQLMLLWVQVHKIDTLVSYQDGDD